MTDWPQDLVVRMGAAASNAPRPTANADQEVWVKERVLTAMRMAMALAKSQDVRADGPSFDYGFDGVAEGAAVEIIHTLGMQAPFVNLRNLPPNGNVR